MIILEGFLHEINQGRTPLVYDIQELFRWLIDVSVIQLLEEKKIKKSDFIITENYHARLGEDVAKLLIEKVNSNFNARYNYKNGKNYSYQIILQDNLQQLCNFVVEKKKELEFIIPKMKLNRNDDLELREKILNITPEERKKLGINKSTLWYIKKNLSEGKTSKIYEKIRQYILAKRGVDIGGNFNLGSVIMPILIVSAIVAEGMDCTG